MKGASASEPAAISTSKPGGQSIGAPLGIIHIGVELRNPEAAVQREFDPAQVVPGVGAEQHREAAQEDRPQISHPDRDREQGDGQPR